MCGQYERRPDVCIDHMFRGYRFCPIGLDVLGLSYPEDTEMIRIRIDEGYEKTKALNENETYKFEFGSEPR